MPSILAVDDSPSMRQMVEYTLRGAGYDVLLAEDGVDALSVAEQNEVVDLVLTDINMPNKNGIELLKDLRQLPKYQYTPMLVLTTESSVEMKTKGKEAGATGWIVKPFNPDKLLSMIGRVLN